MKSYIVLGLGRFGINFAKTAVEMGHEVLGVDNDEKIVQQYANILTHTVQADSTSEDFLKSMDVRKFDAAIVAIGANIQVSIMTTVILKELGAKYILAKAQDDFQAKVLYKIGADKVILPEKDMGIKTAHNIIADNFYDMIEVSNDYSIINIHPPESWVGKSLGELAVRTRYGVNVIAVKGAEDPDVVIPKAGTIISEGDTIVVMGANSDLKRLSSSK